MKAALQTDWKVYLPEEDRCNACKYKNNDCSKLPFSEYREIESYTNDWGAEVVVVKCEEYNE